MTNHCQNTDITLPTLGIIAGRGLLPLEIAKFYAQQNGNCCIAAINNEVDVKFDPQLPYQEFAIGSVGAVIDYFKQFEVKNIIFAGGVRRPNLLAIKADLVGAKLLSKILANKFLGDDSILRVVADFFEHYGFTVISAQDVYANIIMINTNNALTTHTPSTQDLTDIEFGKKIAIALGALDVGQSVIVEDGYVLGIEAAEGTDNLIIRCAGLRKKKTGAVLIKMPKQNQDLRLDLPTIGPDTIKLLANYKYSGLAIDHKTIIINPKATIELANNGGIFISTIDLVY
ncbi:LpxI family protein [Candidatus Trichorickettsia mobilis]|uniref:LpxI family protein n=1 Tax=Candidatus Trichorickettsia mobilis TaxID=1346319 RepID=UPI00292CF429|nr:UDP-2,3-diacylglucosamine diphosphatase LpxI [Candidatus Trichorickettsia mobilis]